MFLKSLELTNLLSFRETKVELRDLNVIIGANGVGKSNLIEVIGLLRSLPESLNAPGGGISEWLWQGQPQATEARIGVGFANRLSGLAYELRSGATERGLTLTSKIRNPALARVQNQFASVRIYREFRTGPRDGTRIGSAIDAPGNRLAEDGSNLAAVLKEMEVRGTLREVERALGALGGRSERISVQCEGDILRFCVEESETGQIPASRLSGGTLKFLCLMAALHSPDPPPLICIEEPEAGLHPDSLRVVAQALCHASMRTQLVVTTYSPGLLDALGTVPESIVVCERDFDNGTQFRRLTSKQVDEWLEDYTLGDLWLKGEIGAV